MQATIYDPYLRIPILTGTVYTIGTSWYDGKLCEIMEQGAARMCQINEYKNFARFARRVLGLRLRAISDRAGDVWVYPLGQQTLAVLDGYGKIRFVGHQKGCRDYLIGHPMERDLCYIRKGKIWRAATYIL